MNAELDQYRLRASELVMDRTSSWPAWMRLGGFSLEPDDTT